jgi:hypothetical protein
VVGLGSQDDLARAQRFVADTGTDTVQMLWDPSGASWRHYGVTRQPAAVLVDSSGAALGSWLGRFDTDEVLDLVAGQ